MIGSADGQLTLNGSGIALGGNTLTFDGAGDFSLQASLGAAGGLPKTGDGTLSIDSPLTTTGTVILAGGTLDLGGLSQTIGTLQVPGKFDPGFQRGFTPQPDEPFRRVGGDAGPRERGQSRGLLCRHQ